MATKSKTKFIKGAFSRFLKSVKTRFVIFKFVMCDADILHGCSVGSLENKFSRKTPTFLVSEKCVFYIYMIF